MVLEGLICCSLQDHLAVPPFLKSSRFLLGTHTINSSWMGARYVFFFLTLHYQTCHTTESTGMREKDVILRLRTAGAGREAPAVARAPSFTPAHNLRFQLFTKCNFSKATPDTARAQSSAEAMQVHFVPRAQTSRYITPKSLGAHCSWIPLPHSNPCL